MILRRLECRGFGCFTDRTFEFRRGLNLVTGPNESGKSILAAAVTAVLFGVRDPERFAPRGARSGCTVTLELEREQRIFRISRDLLTDQVTLEEHDAAHRLRDQFRGRVPASGREPLPQPWLQRIASLLPVAGESLTESECRFLLGDPEMARGEGFSRLLLGLVGSPPSPAPLPPLAGSGDEAMAVDLEQARADFTQGQRYLDWARSQWSLLDATAAGGSELSPAGGKSPARQAELLREYTKTGLPNPLPDELPGLLAEAAEIRGELVAVGGSAAALREDLRRLPRLPWILTVSLSLLAGGGGGAFFWLVPERFPLVLGAATVLAIAAWVWLGWKWTNLRAKRGRLQAQGLVLEQQREAAQERLSELDGRFERLGLSPSAVAVARMQKNLERGRQLLAELAELNGSLPPVATVPPTTLPANLLPREELPEAETRLAALREKIDRLEQLLKAPSAGGAPAEMAGLAPAVATGGAGVPPASTKDGARPFQTPLMTEESGRLLRLLTGGRYGELALEPQRGALMVRGAGGWLAQEQVGQGTRAAAMLALRLAWLRRLPAGSCVPLILDEPGAGLDRERWGEAVKILERLSIGHQIILCSHDEQLIKRGARERWHTISLEEAPAARTAPTQERNDDGGQLHLL